MALPHVTLVYSVPALGASQAAIAAALGAVPIPLATLASLGCYVESDVVATAAVCTRTITLRVNSPDPAVAAAVLVPGQGASGIEKVNVTHAGAGYVRPPTFLPFDPSSQTLEDWLNGSSREGLSPPGSGCKLQAYMKAVGITTLTHGTGYSQQTTAALIGGFPKGTATDTQSIHPEEFLGTPGVGTRTSDPAAANARNELAVVGDIVVLEEGRGYSADTIVRFLGARPVGRPAQAQPVIVGGKVVSIFVTDTGDGYITTPQVSIYDPGGGSGATATANMQRGRPASITVSVNPEGGAITLTLTDGGDGYVEVPTLVIFDPNGEGSGASATVGPVVGGAASQMGVSRVDVLARGSAYTDPALVEKSFFETTFLVAASQGNVTAQLRAFENLMKTAIQNLVVTAVTESVS